MPSQTHFNKAQRLVKRFKEEYNCNYVTTEYDVRLYTGINKQSIKRHHFRYDVYGKDFNENIFIGEVGFKTSVKSIISGFDSAVK